MSFFSIIYTILFGPLELLFENIYMISYYIVGNPGISIIILSILINLLVLPLYKRADAIQLEARDTEAKLKDGMTHIKKTFKGDEKMMILQTYYRQNNYKPADAIKGSLSLLLQIPFFVVAYKFLSNIVILDGASLGPINDLSKPDGMVAIGGVTINVLPILMTLINVISSAVYLKGFPNKSKIQLYGIAFVFLILLYNSPAGLVFYWTLNNVFSLIKNVFSKVKKPSKENKIKDENYDNKFFLFVSLFMTALVGLLIPSALLASSPQDFVDVTYFYNPLWYLVYTFCMAIGTFLIWMRVFYWLATPSGKASFDIITMMISVCMLINYLFFGTNLGIISPSLQYESGLVITDAENYTNMFVMLLAVVVMYVVVTKWKSKLKGVLIVAIITSIGMGIFNVANIHKSISKVEENPSILEDTIPNISLSRNGKNVVVIMLDRGVGEYVPYMFNEKPELKEQFDGFTYYSNTISFGGFTNFGTPALFGGYEYTPVEMNKRDSESLQSKQNEALKIMPVIFDENGYEVTVCDPVYANYQLVPDLSIYDDYPDINTYISCGQFVETSQKEYSIKSMHRNIFCYSIMKTVPICLQDIIYCSGNYNQADTSDKYDYYFLQTVKDNYHAEGISDLFMESYSVLTNLINMTFINDSTDNTFFMMTNKTTHEPMILQLPEYEPAHIVDNTEYQDLTSDVYTVDGRTLKMENEEQIKHYHTNMATMIQIGKWLDYLKENDVYDNTRIIIVADHGRDLRQIEELILGPDEIIGDLGFYFPLMMVKDFDDSGFRTSDEFMTNADVPTMAFNGLVDNPINPFTGKKIDNKEKTAHEQYIILSDLWNVEMYNGNTFSESAWYSVKDNIWDLENWTYYEEEVIIPEGAE